MYFISTPQNEASWRYSISLGIQQQKNETEPPCDRVTFFFFFFFLSSLYIKLICKWGPRLFRCFRIAVMATYVSQIKRNKKHHHHTLYCSMVTQFGDCVKREIVQPTYVTVLVKKKKKKKKKKKRNFGY